MHGAIAHLYPSSTSDSALSFSSAIRLHASLTRSPALFTQMHLTQSLLSLTRNFPLFYTLDRRAPTREI